MDESKTEPQFNGLTKSLNWPTVVLIILSGGGNWLATQKGTHATRDEVNQVIRQIDDIHDKQQHIIQMLEKLTNAH